MLRAMTARRVSLELEAGPSALHGTVEADDGTRETFWGWLELMAALERAMDRPAQETDRDRGDDANGAAWSR
jgi:hypothetical protein